MNARFHCYCPCGSCEEFSHCYRGECDAPKPSLWAVIAEAVANFIAEDDQEWAEEYTQAQRDEFAASIPRLLAALKAASVAVVELPEPSEWVDGQPQWNDYPFVRLTPGADDEIALGATCEHLYGTNRHEARNVAADLLAAADVAEAQR